MIKPKSFVSSSAQNGKPYIHILDVVNAFVIKNEIRKKYKNV